MALKEHGRFCWILIDTAKTTFFQCAVNKSAESKLRIQPFCERFFWQLFQHLAWWNVWPLVLLKDRRLHELTRTLAKFVSVSRTMEENLFSHSISRGKSQTVIAHFITTVSHRCTSLSLIKQTADHGGNGRQINFPPDSTPDADEIILKYHFTPKLIVLFNIHGI